MTIVDDSIFVAMVRSGLFMFYITAGLCSVFLLNKTKETHKYILGILLLLWGIGQLRDIVVQFIPWLSQDYIHNINVLCDLIVLPLCVLFVLTMLYKDYLTCKRTLFNILPFVVWPVLYCLTRCDVLFYIGLCFPFIYLFWAVSVVFRGVGRYQKSIIDNFSYQDNINVKWLKIVLWMLIVNMLICLYLYFCLYSTPLLCYYFAYRMCMWMFIMYKVSVTENHQLISTLSADTDVRESLQNSDHACQSNVWKNRLSSIFRDEKAFLDPKLTVQDVADRIPNREHGVLNGFSGANLCGHTSRKPLTKHSIFLKSGFTRVAEYSLRCW